MTEENLNGIPLPEAGDAKPQVKVPDFLQKDDWYPVNVDNDFLDFDEPYRPPRYTMQRNSVPFADVGELHIISGKPGNGKTGLMSQLEAATLGRQFGNTLARDVGHIVRDENGDIVNGEDHRPIFQVRETRILHIDTEQGKDDTIAFKNRVISMSGIPKEEAKDHFFILRLRDTELAQDRWKKILKAIWQVQPTDIFLDGMLDIVEDYNDQTECQPIIRKCMMLATYYDTSLWAVLHENPMVDKLVGTLGSITQRKVSEIFTVIKIKQSDLAPDKRNPAMPDIYFRVKQNKARGRDVDDWYFEYVTNQGGWGEPKEIEENGANVVDSKEMAFMKEADERFSKLAWTSSGLSRTEVDSGLTKQGVTSNRRRGALIDTGIEHGIIYKTGDKQRPKYHYNGLNKEQPNDEAEEIDFTPNDGPVPY
jgi:hypothetical protein